MRMRCTVSKAARTTVAREALTRTRKTKSGNILAAAYNIVCTYILGVNVVRSGRVTECQILPIIEQILSLLLACVA